MFSRCSHQLSPVTPVHASMVGDVRTWETPIGASAKWAIQEINAKSTSQVGLPITRNCSCFNLLC